MRSTESHVPIGMQPQPAKRERLSPGIDHPNTGMFKMPYIARGHGKATRD